MAEYAYNTRVSLIKAGKIISTKITISLSLIWMALVIGFGFLWINNAGFLSPNNSRSVYNNIHKFSGQGSKQKDEGAFVFVVKNKKVLLTRYTAYIDKNQPDTELSKAANAVEESMTAVVRKRKTSNTPSVQPDFTIKRNPF